MLSKAERKPTSRRPTWASKSYKAEAFDLWHYYSGRICKPYFKMQIDFDGHLDETILAEAFEQACVTFPLVACGFDIPSRIRARWVPRREAAGEILQMVEAPECREEEIQRAYACSLNISEGPQLRAFLVRDAQQDSLCLTVNHMICDGVGCKQYLSVVAQLYSRIAKGLDPSPPPFVPQRGARAVLKAFRIRDWLRKPSSILIPNADETKKLHQATGFAFEDGPFNLLMESLPAANFKPIRTAAKALGFTVNDLFMASLALAWHRERTVNEILLPCTMDLRSFVSSGTEMGITNLSSRCPCVIRISPGDMMEDVMAKVTEPMKVYKQGLYAVNQLFGWQIRSRFISLRRMNQIFQNAGTTFSLGATNTGIVDEDCIRFGNASVRRAYMAPPAPLSPTLAVAISTFRDELIVSAGVEGDETAKEFARAIFAAMMEELRDFGSRHPV
jgi:NRPS condensation-like uncharacterized protein